MPKERIRKRKCDTEKKEKKREFTYKYRFIDPTNEDYDIRVCQKMFLDILYKSTQMILTAFEKKTATGGLKKDKRGQHGKQKKLDASREEIVMKHIESFKVVESHYVRKSLLDYQFLPQNLSVKEMHRMYI